MTTMAGSRSSVRSGEMSAAPDIPRSNLTSGGTGTWAARRSTRSGHQLRGETPVDASNELRQEAMPISGPTDGCSCCRRRPRLPPASTYRIACQPTRSQISLLRIDSTVPCIAKCWREEKMTRLFKRKTRQKLNVDQISCPGLARRNYGGTASLEAKTSSCHLRPQYGSSRHPSTRQTC
jgi:hypothetical protein